MSSELTSQTWLIGTNTGILLGSRCVNCRISHPLIYAPPVSALCAQTHGCHTTSVGADTPL